MCNMILVHPDPRVSARDVPNDFIGIGNFNEHNEKMLEVLTTDSMKHLNPTTLVNWVGWSRPNFEFYRCYVIELYLERIRRRKYMSKYVKEKFDLFNKLCRRYENYYKPICEAFMPWFGYYPIPYSHRGESFDPVENVQRSYRYWLWRFYRHARWIGGEIPDWWPAKQQEKNMQCEPWHCLNKYGE